MVSGKKVSRGLGRVINDGPTIFGARVTLRPVTPADLPFLQSLWNDGQVMQYVGAPAGLGMTGEKMAQWWDKCQSWTATHLIVETLNGVPIGESGWGFVDIPGMLELKLARAHWGQGLAGDALEALLNYIFDRTAIREVIVTPHRENTAARKLYRRLGFQPTSPPPNFNHFECWTLSRSHPQFPNTLIFDWGGVLMRTEDDRGRRYWEAQLGLPAGAADRAVFESAAWREAQLGLCTVGECWTAIGRSLGLTPTRLAQFRRDFWAGDQLNRPLIQRIHRWRAAGSPVAKIALLSNYSPELDNLLDEHQVRSLFNPVIVSAYEGIMKPASRLFWRALNRIGVSPAEALFVDDFSGNVAGARSVGLHAVQFRDTQQASEEITRLLP